MDLGIDGLGDATEIGVGGSAIVYRSSQTRLDRDVAVKVLTVADPNFVRRFEREARLLGKLSQKPGIVTVHDTGLTGKGQPYLVLELCPSSLQDRLTERGPMMPRDACKLLAKVAGAVAEAHELGVVHRDLKPGNILISPGGEPLVADFGIATVGGTTMGQTNSVGFSPGYVAPETVGGDAPSDPADVYALGATLFYMVSGELPFDDPTGNQNLLALAGRVMNEPIPDLRPRGIPEAVCHIIDLAMDKDPARRPSALQLQLRLEAAAAGTTNDPVEPSPGQTTIPGRSEPTPTPNPFPSPAVDGRPAPPSRPSHPGSPGGATPDPRPAPPVPAAPAASTPPPQPAPGTPPPPRPSPGTFGNTPPPGGPQPGPATPPPRPSPGTFSNTPPPGGPQPGPATPPPRPSPGTFSNTPPPGGPRPNPTTPPPRAAPVPGPSSGGSQPPRPPEAAFGAGGPGGGGPATPPPFQPDAPLGFAAGAAPGVSAPPLTPPPTPQPFRGGPAAVGAPPGAAHPPTDRRSRARANKAAYKAAKRARKQRPRGFVDFVLAIIRGSICAVGVFCVGLGLFFLGLYQQTGGFEYDSNVPIEDAAGIIGVIGVIVYAFGPVVAFIGGIIWLPWPKRWA